MLTELVLRFLIVWEGNNMRQILNGWEESVCVFFRDIVPLFAWKISTINKIRCPRSGKEFWARIFTIYRVSQEEWTILRESVPYVKIYRYNPKHLCPKLNGYGNKGQGKVWSFCGSTYCTWLAWRNTHTLRIVCPYLQLTQARSSLRLHM